MPWWWYFSLTSLTSERSKIPILSNTTFVVYIFIIQYHLGSNILCVTNWVTIEGPGGESWPRLTNSLEWFRAVSEKYHLETMWRIAWSYLATSWIVIVIVVSVTFVEKRLCQYQKTWEKWLQVCSERRRWPIAALPVVKSLTDTEGVKWFTRYICQEQFYPRKVHLHRSWQLCPTSCHKKTFLIKCCQF